MFNPFQRVMHLNEISKKDAKDLAAWEFIHPQEESAWDREEREQENQERFRLGIHGYDHNGNVIEPPNLIVVDFNSGDYHYDS